MKSERKAAVADPVNNPYNIALAVSATGLVVFGDGNGVTAVHASDGSPAWSYQLDPPSGQITGPPAIARDGTIYLEGASSVLALTNAGHLLWQAPETSGPGRAGTGLALDPAGTLYAVIVDSNNNGKLVAFES